jgi:hypothetical protein
VIKVVDRGSQNDYIGFPFFFSVARSGEEQSVSKLAHDSYQVYVNNHYVGNKVLIAQNEKIEDVEKYLKNTGFENFSTKIEGNQYKINSQGTESEDLRDTLSVYLHNR